MPSTPGDEPPKNRLGVSMRPVLPQVGGDPPLRAVLFDAGLTLLSTSTPPEDVARPVLESHGLNPEREALSAAMSRAEAEITRQWLTGDWFASERTVRLLFVSAYRVGLRAFPEIARDDELAANVADGIYYSYRGARHWGLYEDVVPALESLHAHRVAMAVVSDWGHGLEAILLELELGKYFQHLAVSSRLGISKPDPAVFLTALARLEAASDEAVFVGDTYVKDVLGARAAGIEPVLLDRPGTGPVVDCTKVSTLTELLPLVGLQPPDSHDTAS